MFIFNCIFTVNFMDCIKIRRVLLLTGPGRFINPVIMFTRNTLQELKWKKNSFP
jgi:hypothetical protein